MKKIIIFIVFFFLQPNVFFGQEYNFKRKVIHLATSDTTDCIKFMTDNAIIFIKKRDYLNLAEADPTKIFEKYVEQHAQPQVCLVERSEHINTLCNGSFFPQQLYSILAIKYDVLKFLIKSKCTIYLYGSNQIINKLLIKHKIYKGAFDDYLVILEAKSKKEIMSLLYALGE